MANWLFYEMVVLTALIAGGLLLMLWIRNHGERKNGGVRSTDDTKHIINRALKALNCTAKWQVEADTAAAHYDYQGGHFSLRIDRDSPYTSMVYPRFFEAQLEDIELVRFLCNECNVKTEACFLVYSVDDDQATVDVHVVASLSLHPNTAQDELARVMGAAFHWQHVFTMRYAQLAETSKRAYNHDVEKQNAKWKRELFLTRELEISHQDDGVNWAAGFHTELSLRDMLQAVVGLTDIVVARLTTTGGNGETTIIDEPEAIMATHFAPLLIQDGRFVNRSAVALLDYFDPRNPVQLRHLTITLVAEDETAHTLYYRVTMAATPLSMSMEAPNDIDRRRQMSSVLVGYDLTTSEKRMEEFRYILKEAKAKQMMGQTDELTDDERLLCELEDPSCGPALLRGRALYEQKRYYESILLLENIFWRMQGAFDAMGLPGREVFMEVSYLVGSCYAHLRQYRVAYYFLQLTLPAHRMLYMETFVNCLVNSHDFRAMTFIDSFLQELQPMMGPDQDEDASPMEGEVGAFVCFLTRRKAFLLVRGENYDEAEPLLRRLLDDPNSSSFALKELAYIQRMKTGAGTTST